MGSIEDGRETAAPRWFDSHCHLDPLPGALEQLRNARREGVTGLVDVGTDLEDSLARMRGSESLENVWTTVGIHPHHADQDPRALEAVLGKAGPNGKVVAIGECGLDYFRSETSRSDQQDVFEYQVLLANRLDLPLVVHVRDAWEDAFDCLRAAGVPRRIVFHCFTGGRSELVEALGIGAMISLSGIVSFPSAGELRSVVADIPADRLLIETDTPYLAPAPVRGSRNEPANTVLVGEAVASLRGVDAGEVASLTFQNACGFFGVDPRTGRVG